MKNLVFTCLVLSAFAAPALAEDSNSAQNLQDSYSAKAQKLEDSYYNSGLKAGTSPVDNGPLQASQDYPSGNSQPPVQVASNDPSGRGEFYHHRVRYMNMHHMQMQHNHTQPNHRHQGL